MTRIRIFGAGAAGAKIVHLIQWELSDLFEVEGFYDDRRDLASGPGGYPIFGSIADGVEWTASGKAAAVIALGMKSAAKAASLFLKLDGAGVALPSLIARSAHVSPAGRIGRGTVIFPNCYFGHDAELGHLCSVSAAAVIEHHAKIKHNVWISTAAVVGAFSAVSSHALIGIAAVIVPEVRVGRGTLVGAGTIVMKSVGDHVVVLGNPGRVIRKVQAGDELATEQEIQSLGEIGWD
ncbi:MAG TPA: hypothetical protein VEU96_32015 [Bryobacteraceae bacterium]|nr:hypothetical protein [Bryobacteraceae bacterium]